MAGPDSVDKDDFRHALAPDGRPKKYSTVLAAWRRTGEQYPDLKPLTSSVRIKAGQLGGPLSADPVRQLLSAIKNAELTEFFGF